jgi:hypothetical protein
MIGETPAMPSAVRSKRSRRTGGRGAIDLNNQAGMFASGQSDEAMPTVPIAFTTEAG